MTRRIDMAGERVLQTRRAEMMAEVALYRAQVANLEAQIELEDAAREEELRARKTHDNQQALNDGPELFRLATVKGKPN